MLSFLFYKSFGGGPYVADLHPCEVCQEKLNLLDARRKQEFEAFNENSADSEYMYVISREWFKSWANFVCGREVGEFAVSYFIGTNNSPLR